MVIPMAGKHAVYVLCSWKTRAIGCNGIMVK